MSFKTVHRPIRISDADIVRGYVRYIEQRDRGEYLETADTVLKKMTRKPMRAIWRAMNRAFHRGYISCGVSLRTGWPTDNGMALLADQPQDSGDKLT